MDGSASQTPVSATNSIACKKDLLDLDCSPPSAGSSYSHGNHQAGMMGLPRYANPPPAADCYLSSPPWIAGGGDSVQHQHQLHQHQQAPMLNYSSQHPQHQPGQLHHQQQHQHQQTNYGGLHPAMYDAPVVSRHHPPPHQLIPHQHLQPPLPPPRPQLPPHHQHLSEQQQQQQQHQLKAPFAPYLPLCHQPLGDGLSGVSSTVYHSAATGGVVSKGAQLPPPPPPPLLPPPPPPPLPHSHSAATGRSANNSGSSKSSSCSPPAGGGRGLRPDKRPVPDSQKDTKYFERRKRNNEAAKKSRDARKHREDEIAVRASFLEKENAVLKAQMASLREEANSLRELLRKHSALR